MNKVPFRKDQSRSGLISMAICMLCLLCLNSNEVMAQHKTALITNPIVKGYFADPCIIKDKDVFYIYATIDPWGGDELAVLETKDFKKFERKHINWPTKAACTSPTSSDSKVWAPSVRKAANGKYYMYVAVGSEVWAGVSEHPLGPWKNAKADNSPLVAKNDFPQVHNIDADCFIDDDGQAYLYWGSGYKWINGHCMAVKLKSDMVTFDGTPQEVTPPHYFEAPHMIKRYGKYYLMFSDGKAIDATYKVGYAVGNSPFGPFTEGINSPILSSSADSTIIGPGHHTVFNEKGQDYILYHRILPQKAKYVLRQLCIDSLNFDEHGNIRKIIPAGVAPFTAKVPDFKVTDYGAIGDGKTNNTVAIQKAIDKAFASGGGRVVVPAGKFITGVITLKSHVELHLAEGARLMATAHRAAYGPKKASALIVATGVNHVAITGKGTIDGQAKLLLEDIYKMLNAGTLEDREWKTYNDWHQMRPEENNRPHLIDFKNCDHITIKNVTIRDGLCWIQDYRNCSNIKVDSITVESNTFLNNDGIDITDSKNVSITNSSFNVADDGVCLKSSDANGGCENVYVANCKIRSSASAFKLGTASRGGFKNVTVRNLYIYDTYRSAIAIESVDGGNIENIDIRNVEAKNTGNAIFIRLGKRSKNAAAGFLKNVYISDVKVQVPAGKPDAGYSMEGPEVPKPHNVFPSGIAGIPGHPVENVTLNHIAITYEGGAKKEVAQFGLDSLSRIPENIGDYPEFSMFGELPAWGLFVRHAEGIHLKNVTLDVQRSEFRAACVFDDVKVLTLNGLQISKAVSEPVILFKNVKDKVLEDVHIPGSPVNAIQTKEE